MAVVVHPRTRRNTSRGGGWYAASAEQCSKTVIHGRISDNKATVREKQRDYPWIGDIVSSKSACCDKRGNANPLLMPS
jgi:hypothetical protein